MTFTEAIDKKYITDYKIWLPSIHEDNSLLENSDYGILSYEDQKFYVDENEVVNNRGITNDVVYINKNNEVIGIKTRTHAITMYPKSHKILIISVNIIIITNFKNALLNTPA